MSRQQGLVAIAKQVAAAPCLCHPMGRRTVCLSDQARLQVGDYRLTRHCGEPRVLVHDEARPVLCGLGEAHGKHDWRANTRQVYKHCTGGGTR